MTNVNMFFSFNGRIKRGTFWKFFSLLILIFIALNIIGDSILNSKDGSYQIFLVIKALQLSLLWPFLALAIKRFHDINKTGWWVLWAFFAVLGTLWVLIQVGLIKGTEGPNKYGDIAY